MCRDGEQWLSTNQEVRLTGNQPHGHLDLGLLTHGFRTVGNRSLVWQTIDRGWCGSICCDVVSLPRGRGAGSSWADSPSPGIHWCWFADRPPFVEGGGRPKTEVATPGWQVAGLRSKGTHSKAGLWCHEKKRSLCPATQALRFIERPSGFSHRAIGWPPHITVLRPHPWGSLRVGKASRVHLPRTGEGVRSLQVPGSSSQVNWRSCALVLSMISSSGWVSSPLL